MGLYDRADLFKNVAVDDTSIADELAAMPAYQAPKPVLGGEESGYIGGTVKSLGRGLAGAAQFAGDYLQDNHEYMASGDSTANRDQSKLGIINRLGQSISDTAEAAKNSITAPVHGGNEVKRSIFEGVESIPTSMALQVPAVAATYAGRAGGAILGAAGGPAGAVAGGLAGGVGSAALAQGAMSRVMHGATRQQTLGELDRLQTEGKLKEGVTQAEKMQAAEEAARAEWQGEMPSSIVESLIYSRLPAGKTLASIVKPGIKQFAKNMAMTAPLELGGEAYTSHEQTGAMNSVLAPQYQGDKMQAAVGSLGPTAVMTTTMGGMGTLGQRYAGRGIATALENPAVSQSDRVEAAKAAARLIENDHGKQAADNFITHAVDAIGDAEQTGTDPYALNLSNPELLTKPFTTASQQVEEAAPVASAATPLVSEQEAGVSPSFTPADPESATVKPTVGGVEMTPVADDGTINPLQNALATVSDTPAPSQQSMVSSDIPVLGSTPTADMYQRLGFGDTQSATMPAGSAPSADFQVQGEQLDRLDPQSLTAGSGEYALNRQPATASADSQQAGVSAAPPISKHYATADFLDAFSADVDGKGNYDLNEVVDAQNALRGIEKNVPVGTPLRIQTGFGMSVLAPSAKKDGVYQISRFDKNGEALGDSEFTDYHQAVRELGNEQGNSRKYVDMVAPFIQPTGVPEVQAASSNQTLTPASEESKPLQPAEDNKDSIFSGAMAADYLLTGGFDVMLSTEYLLQAYSGLFQKSSAKVEQIRKQYVQEIKDRGLDNVQDFVKSDLYAQITSEMQAVVAEDHGDSAAVADIFNDVAKYPTGMPPKVGDKISKKIEALEAAASAPSEVAQPQTPLQPAIEAPESPARSKVEIGEQFNKEFTAKYLQGGIESSRAEDLVDDYAADPAVQQALDMDGDDAADYFNDLAEGIKARSKQAPKGNTAKTAVPAKPESSTVGIKGEEDNASITRQDRLWEAESTSTEEVRAILQGGEQKNGEQVESVQQRQADIIREWAGKNGRLADHQQFTDAWNQQTIDGGEAIAGTEQQVILAKGDQLVYKRKLLWPDETWLQYFDRLDAHNRHFPETAYTLHGFTDAPSAKGMTFMARVSQPYSDRLRDATEAEITDYMGEKGFESFEDPKFASLGIKAFKYLKWRHKETGHVVGDLGPNNVWMGTDGKVAVIDPTIDMPEAAPASKKAPDYKGVVFTANSAGKRGAAEIFKPVLNQSRMATLQDMLNGMDGKERGGRIAVDVDGMGGSWEWSGYSSSFPEWFKNKGYNSKDIKADIQRLFNGDGLTRIQLNRLDGIAAEVRRENVNYILAGRKAAQAEAADFYDEVVSTPVPEDFDELFEYLSTGKTSSGSVEEVAGSDAPAAPEGNIEESQASVQPPARQEATTAVPYGEAKQETLKAARDIIKTLGKSADRATAFDRYESLRNKKTESLTQASFMRVFDEVHANMGGKSVKVLEMEVEAAAAKEVADQGDIFAVVPEADKPAHRKLDEDGRATDGKPINAGEQFLTASGRLTTPYPKAKGEKYASKWLIDNAVAEAESRGDRFNKGIFSNETILKRGDLPAASRESMLMYLFGEKHPAVAPSILKPLSVAAPVDKPAQPAELVKQTLWQKSPDDLFQEYVSELQDAVKQANPSEPLVDMLPDVAKERNITDAWIRAGAIFDEWASQISPSDRKALHDKIAALRDKAEDRYTDYIDDVGDAIEAGMGVSKPARDAFKEDGGSWESRGKNNPYLGNAAPVKPTAVQTTAESHIAFTKQLINGDVKIDVFKAAFTQLQASKDSLLAELGKMTKDQLLKRMGSMMAYRYKSEKKAYVVDAAYRSMEDSFIIGRSLVFSPFGDGRVTALVKLVESTTTEDLQNFASQFNKAPVVKETPADVTTVDSPMSKTDEGYYVSSGDTNAMFTLRKRTQGVDHYVTNLATDKAAAELKASQWISQNETNDALKQLFTGQVADDLRDISRSAPVEKPFDASNLEEVKPDAELTPQDVIAKNGLLVTQNTAKSGKTYWTVTGDTKRHEQLLNDLGFAKPFKLGKVWGRSVFDADPTEKLANALAGNVVIKQVATIDRSDAEFYIKKAKLKVEEKNGAWFVTGKTYESREAINEAGGQWTGSKETGYKFTEDPTERLGATLKEFSEQRGSDGAADEDNAGTGIGAAEADRLQQLRVREDGRGDERLNSADIDRYISEDTKKLIRKGIEFGVPVEVANDQIEDVAGINAAYQSKKPMYLLANGAGTGKTFVLGGTIRELRAAGATKFVYVTQSQDLINQIKRDLAPYGIGDVSFQTYAEMSGKNKFSATGAVLIFDEGHNVKNVGDSKRGMEGQKLMASAQFTIFASATPYQNPVEAEYLAGTGIFNAAGGFKDWAKMYGAAVRKFKVYNPKTNKQEEQEIVYWPGRGKKTDGAAARQWMFKQGVMSNRPMKIDASMVDTQFRRNKVDQKWVELYDRVNTAYDDSMNKWLDEDGNSRDAKITAEISRHRENAIKRILESSKTDAAVARAKELLEDGKNVVVFVETKSERFLGKWRRSQHFGDDTLYTYPQMQEMMREWEVESGMAKMMGEKAPPRPFAQFIYEIARSFDEFDILQELPSTADEIQSALKQYGVGIYTGDVTQQAASKNKTEFLSGKKRVLIATMAKGGTGLSLHDTVGNRPTVQLNLNLPWAAWQVDQVAARVARYGLKSKAVIEWLFASNIPWESTKLAPRVGSRMSDMGAIVNGVEMKSAEKLLGDFDFEGVFDVKQAFGEGIIDLEGIDNGPDFGGDEYALAARLENIRSKATDTSNGYFATPYPLSVLMKRVAGLQAGQSMLEPSAGGSGNLLRFVPEGVSITAVEQRPDNFASLQQQYGSKATLHQSDFMDFNPSEQYDVIMMNPPFERKEGVGAQDVAHVMKAYGHLANGGRLVAVMGEGAFFRNFKQETGFREWLDSVGATVVRMPEGAFKKSGTMVRTRMIVVDKDSNGFRSDIDLQDMSADNLKAVEGMIPPRQQDEPELNLATLKTLDTLDRAWATQMQRFDAIERDGGLDPKAEYWKRRPSKVAAIAYITEQKMKGETGTVQDLLGELSHMEEDEYNKYAGYEPVRGKFAIASPTTGTKASDIKAALKGHPLESKIVVTQSQDGWPLSDADRFSLKGQRASGLYQDGKIYLAADNLKSVEHALAVALGHELSHAGQTDKLTDMAVDWFRKVYDNPKTRNELGNKAAMSLMVEAKKRGLDLKKTDDFRAAVQEATAVMAESLYTNGVKSPLLNRMMAYIKHFLRNTLGWKSLGYTDKEIAATVSEMMRVGEKDLGKGGGKFSIRSSTLTIDDKERPTTNSNGQPIHTTDEGIRNFYKWFGDSKVVDEQGRPLVVYHGSGNDISVFKSRYDMRLRGESKSQSGGIYFSKDKEYAGGYGGKQAVPNENDGVVYPVYLKIKNPSIHVTPSGDDVVDYENTFTTQSMSQREKEELQKQGYDGMINDLARELVVFSPTQIKSATGNTGAFDGGNPDMRLSIAADTMQYGKEFFANNKPADLLKGLGSVLSPDILQRVTRSANAAFPKTMDAIGAIFNVPVFQGERDAAKRKDDEVSINDFVETGIKRAENNMEFQLEMMGWDGPAAQKPSFMQRVKEGVTQWDTADTTTKWGRIQKAVNKSLNDQQRAALDIMQREGDVNKTAYPNLATAMKNKRIAAAKPDKAVFDAYKQVRDFIDNDMVAAREKLIIKLGEATGADKELVAQTIKAFRAHIGEWKGWMPRKHGEGQHQVNVYHTIKDLPFTDQAVEDGHQATIPYYAGKDVAREIRTFAREYGLLVSKNNLGAPVVTASDKTQEKVAKDIEKLEKKLAETAIAEEQEVLQAKLETMNKKLELVSRPSDERIAEFVEASKGFLGNIRDQYETSLTELRDQLDKAKQDGVHKGEIRKIKNEIEKLGDGTVKVKLYMRLHESEAQAQKHKAEVAADLKGKLDHVYHAGEEYTTTYKQTSPISEGLFGDMAGDFAAENIIKEAIEKAQQTGKLGAKEAEAVRTELFRNYANVMLSRGSGRHQIQRAPYLIQGYDQTDTTQLYRDYMTSAAGMLSKAMYAKQQFDNYRYAPADIKGWSEGYIKDTLRNMDHKDRIGANVRAVATFMYLGFKMSSILVNGTQTWTLGVAELGRRTKQNGIKAVGKAQLDIIKDRLSADEQRLFNDQLWKEQEMATAIHEMSGQNEGSTGKVSKFMHTLVGKSLLPFQEMEMLNRRTMVLAAYRSFRADGLNREEAIKQAMDVNRKTNFEMSRANLPQWAHHPVGRTAYALQSFVWNNWNWIYNRATSGEKADLLALLKYAGMISAIGGVAALAGGDEINKIIRRLTGKDYKLAMEVWARQHAKEYGTAGELMNAAVWHGGMGALGINISNAMRLNVPMSGFITGDTTAGESAMGIWSGLYDKGENTIKYASRGQVGKALEAASPAAIEAPLKAYRMATQGATTTHGKPIFDENGKPLKYSAAEAAARAVGLQPLEQSFRAEVTRSERKLTSYWSEKRGTLLDEIRVATGDRRKEVVKEIVKFNTEVRKSQAWPLVNVISADTIRKSTSASKPNKKKQAWERQQLAN